MNKGKLIHSLDGYTSGMKIGAVYTAARGESGFVAGYWWRGNRNIGLCGERKFASAAAAKDYAAQVTYAP